MNIFETVSFHIVKPCNMSCKFCFATFQDQHVINQLPLTDAMNIITKLKEAGVEKITFAGGEPMMYKNLDIVIQFSKNIGLTTSIITNGSMITNEWLQKMKGKLDWIGLSVDSLSKATNIMIGRSAKNNPNYIKLVELIKTNKFRLKINTVVNSYNHMDDMNNFISFAKPDRWKIFQTLKIKEQNDEHWEEIKVTDNQYWSFIQRHNLQTAMVVEDNEQMTGSYLLIDPLGRLFENSGGIHTYSDPLQNRPIEHCLEQINLNRSMFLKRGGIYAW